VQVFNLEVLVTAHTEKERLEWEGVFVEQIIRHLHRARGVSIYDGRGAFSMNDDTVIYEPHSRIVVYGESAHEIHQLYAGIYPTLLEYLEGARQETVLVLMNGNVSLIRLPEQVAA
jgi:hypothetical protein